MVAIGYQGARWNVVPKCTCLWQVNVGWELLADDANCPAHHPNDPAPTVSN